MQNVEIFGFSPSTYTQTAIMIAYESEAPFSVKPLEFKKSSHLALHPYGKMPVLKHGSVVLYETLAIGAYLDRVFGKSRLTPKGDEQYAQMLSWASVAIDYVYPRLVGAFLADEVSTEDKTAAAEQLKLLDVGLGKKHYFGGDQVSLADLMLYPMVKYGQDKLTDAQPDGLPALEAWRVRLAQRESVKHVEEIA